MKNTHLKILSILLACSGIALSAGTPTDHVASDPLAGSAVDVKGVRYGPNARKEGTMPIKQGHIEYPFEARRWHITGKGLFRVTIDATTGYVTRVAVLHSTGNRGLDQSAVAGLRQCQWKPGKWKEIDIPVDFTLFR
ncbi:MAG: energy transducer TonB [Chthoniobacterales bacterium]